MCVLAVHSLLKLSGAFNRPPPPRQALKQKNGPLKRRVSSWEIRACRVALISGGRIEARSLLCYLSFS